MRRNCRAARLPGSVDGVEGVRRRRRQFAEEFLPQKIRGSHSSIGAEPRESGVLTPEDVAAFGPAISLSNVLLCSGT